MGFSVLVDFDGTVALEDTTDLMLERFADPLWHTVEDDWVAGRIGSRECLSRQIDMVRASAADLDRLADEVAIDPAFAEFAAVGDKLGWHLVIGSDGFDRIISRVLTRIGVKIPVASNRLVPLGEDRWRAEFPHFLGSCRSQSGNCKCALRDGTPNPMILIGDGRSDFCPAAHATLVLAKKSLAIFCKESRIDHITIDGFADALLALRAFGKAFEQMVPPHRDETEAFYA